MNTRYLFFLAAVFSIFVANSVAQPAASVVDEHLELQRKNFMAAEALAHNPNSRTFKRLMRSLEGYPLTPYIELKTLTKFPYMANQKRIAKFLKNYESTPLDKPLRKKWLQYLAKKNQPDLFIEFYRDLGDSALTCQYGSYLINKDPQHQEALALAESLWVVGKSQPKQCDPLFSHWQQLGLRTPELVLKRLALAANGGNHTLIPYLKTLLPKPQQYLADLWLKVRRSPSQVSRISNFPKQFPEVETDIMVYGLNRLISRDRELALKSWEKLSNQFTFSTQQLTTLTHRFAVFLALADHPQAETWLEKASNYQPDAELLRWHLAHVLRQQDWQHAIDVIDFVPEEVAQDFVFQYWKSRAYGQLAATDLATLGLQKLAKHRHYYGFLASAKLAIPANLNNIPLYIAQADLHTIASMPSAQRAFEFRHLGRNLSARREWIYLQSQLTTEQQLTAAVLASQQNWHDQAIFGFTRAGYLDDLARRFPMPFDTHLQTHAKKNDIDPAWAFAIARRESSFMPDAASGAGALGLMQVMPGTARYLTKQKVGQRHLFNPAKNVALGTKYMRYLLNKMDNNTVLATASYNAGWRRVKQWLPENQPMALDLWIETIPYKETRNYVKAVMAYQQIYQQQLGEKGYLFNELAHMQIEPSG
ncbi:transglycosylase SLT domain-containing protein [Paraglaciecola aestuariivivens]